MYICDVYHGFKVKEIPVKKLGNQHWVIRIRIFHSVECLQVDSDKTHRVLVQCSGEKNLGCKRNLLPSFQPHKYLRLDV